jgi:hypothetical protein
MCVYLANKLDSNLSLNSIVKQIKFKHNNMLMNKFMSMRLNLNVYNILSLYTYIYKTILILT